MNKRIGLAYAIAVLIVLAFALARIADTYRTFNHTNDEIAHIGTGMEWWDGQYNQDLTHPPMRAVFAVGPRLLGIHTFGEANVRNDSLRILYERGDYKRTLTAARIGALPFFLLTMAVVGIWAARIAGPAAALTALLAYSMLPLALAHAGLATNDTLVTGTLSLAFFLWALWLEKPSRERALAFGAAAALAVLSKFSAIPFLGIVVLVSAPIWVARAEPVERRARLRTLTESAILAFLIGAFVLWAGYRFSLEPIVELNKPHVTIDRLFGIHGWVHDLAYRLVELPVPAPEFSLGLRELGTRVHAGNPAYLMGEAYNHGRWSFFPIGVMVKTPIAFLLLAVFGIAILGLRCKRESGPAVCLPVLGVMGMLAVCLPSTVNAGVRYILPIFPLLAIAIGAGVAVLWKRRQTSPVSLAAGFLLLAWLTVSSVRAHPDYLAYFNECCDREPQAWLVDSDLDWGQDLDRLAATLKRKGVEHIHLAYFGSAQISRHGLPDTTPLRPGEPVHGWVAVSEFRYVMGDSFLVPRPPPNSQYRWLDAYEPFERVGRSIRLYYVP